MGWRATSNGAANADEIPRATMDLDCPSPGPTTTVSRPPIARSRIELCAIQVVSALPRRIRNHGAAAAVPAEQDQVAAVGAEQASRGLEDDVQDLFEHGRGVQGPAGLQEDLQVPDPLGLAALLRRRSEGAARGLDVHPVLDTPAGGSRRRDAGWPAAPARG